MRLYDLATRLSENQKQALLMGVDLTAVTAALVLATVFHASMTFMPLNLDSQIRLLPFVLLVAAGLSSSLGLGRVRLQSYEPISVFRITCFSVALAVVAVSLNAYANSALSVPNMAVTPASVYVLFGVFVGLLSMGLRYGMRLVLTIIYRRNPLIRRVAIYGAGATGMQLAAALSGHDTLLPVVFIDDNPALIGQKVAGLPVVSAKNLGQHIADHGISRILLAMPSLAPMPRNAIARRLRGFGVEVQAVPSFAQLAQSKGLVETLAPVDVSSLLGRDALDGILPRDTRDYRGKVFLVTGAGGSIGSELCRQILTLGAKKLIMLDSSEFALYAIDRELRDMADWRNCELVCLLGDAGAGEFARDVMMRHDVQIVFHAAAFKHVPMVEGNVLAGLQNNVLATRQLALAAQDAKVEKFILISSDKAVRPSNVMGATKRMAEIIVQDLATRSTDTCFSMVRFGNVLGSSGSVVPLFHEQIQRGGPVTLTHPDVTRYFMTASEAVRLVLMAGSYATGGDVMVLDMGQPVRIRDLARRMIESAGYSVKDSTRPDGDIEIEITGLRPGEKLYEELLICENRLTTPHPKILRAQEDRLSEIEVASALREFERAIAQRDDGLALNTLRRWVSGYLPAPVSTRRKA